jgi:hypothetical protein
MKGNLCACANHDSSVGIHIADARVGFQSAVLCIVGFELLFNYKICVLLSLIEVPDVEIDVGAVVVFRIVEYGD